MSIASRLSQAQGILGNVTSTCGDRQQHHQVPAHTERSCSHRREPVRPDSGHVGAQDGRWWRLLASGAAPPRLCTRRLRHFLWKGDTLPSGWWVGGAPRSRCAVWGRRTHVRPDARREVSRHPQCAGAKTPDAGWRTRTRPGPGPEGGAMRRLCRTRALGPRPANRVPERATKPGAR